MWVGEPEAISSVRRPQKPPCRQRIDQILARTRSLKERPSTARSFTGSEDREAAGRHDSGSSTPRSCSRGGSLKELPIGGVKSGRETGPLSRGGSLKDASNNSLSSSKITHRQQHSSEMSGAGCSGDDSVYPTGCRDAHHCARRALSLRYKSVKEEPRSGDT